jgi:hypothetical protein
VTGALIGLQVLCVILLVVSLVLARVTRHQAWLWLMALAAIGLVVCAGLATWGPVLGLGRPD